tara:strand:- start:2168 stop:3124 length:957 start_codon:yes stop_codon:yes gene_type:complete
MDNWSYINYDDLIQSIINGNHSIQQPFSVNSLDNTKSKNLSFLNYLLSYENVNRENILETLYGIYANLHHKIKRVNNNTCVQHMVNRIKDEWFIDGNTQIIPDKIIDYEYFKNNSSAIKEYNDICTECDNIYSLCKTEGDVPYESKLTGSLPMVRYVESIDIILSEALEKINSQMEMTNKLIQFFNGSYVSLLLDLSIKHKSLYNVLDNNNEIVNVPDNIHIIYSNYLYIHNLLHKQTIQNIKHLSEIISDLKLRIDKIKGLKGNIQTLSEISKRLPNDNEESEKEKEIEEEIYNKAPVNEIEELSGGKVSDKVLSFF